MFLFLPKGQKKPRPKAEPHRRSWKKAHVASLPSSIWPICIPAPPPVCTAGCLVILQQWRWHLLEGNYSHPHIIPLLGSCHHDGAGTTSSQPDKEQAGKSILPNSRFSPVQLLIGKSGRLFIRMVGTCVSILLKKGKQ